MAILDGLNRGTAGQLDVTLTATTINQSFQRNGRAVAADFSLYVATAPAEGAKGATDKVMQGILMRADNVMYITTSNPTGTLSLPSGVKLRSDRVVVGTSSPTAPIRAAFDPLIGTVLIDAIGRLYVDI